MKNTNTVRLTKEQVEALLVVPKPVPTIPHWQIKDYERNKLAIPMSCPMPDPVPNQTKKLIQLYKIVFPEWDEITSVDGFPKVNEETNEYLFKLWIAFDKDWHPDCVAGGMWMNNGFSSAEGNKHLAFLEVERCAVTLKARELAAA